MRGILPVSLVVMAFLGLGPAHTAEKQYFRGYIGLLPSEPHDLAGTYFNRPEVRHVMEALESGPIDEATAEKLLEGSKTTLSDLQRLKLVVIDKGTVRIGFPFFTKEDMQRIHGVAAKYVPKLVSAYVAHANRFAGIFARYPVRSVAGKRLAFVMLAGFGLNWDGLELLEETGLRKPMLVKGPGYAYGFWASEDTPEYSYKGFYWGSSGFPAKTANLDPPLDFTFSSFGDPFSDPRMNFPDLLTAASSDMTPRVRAAAENFGLHNEDVLGMKLKNVIGFNASRGIGRILFAMRAGAADRAQICAAMERAGRAHCVGLLSLLEAAGYIAPQGQDRYVLMVPVLDRGDKAMLGATLTLNRNILKRWLSDNYEPMRRELGQLTAMKQGVPYPALFSQIWHEMFGLTTRELVAAGVIEDPYAAGFPWKGSVPALWRTTLYRLP